MENTEEIKEMLKIIIKTQEMILKTLSLLETNEEEQIKINIEN